MLVTFSCDAYAPVTLFGNVGLELLKMMGCKDDTSGIISANDLEATLEHLRAALKKVKQTSRETAMDIQDTDFADENVSLTHRALPLMELLKVAAEAKCNVWWETT